MMIILPWIAFAVSVALLFVSSEEHREAPTWRDIMSPVLLLLLGGAVAAGLGAGVGGIFTEHKWALFGIAIGLVFPAVTALLEQRRPDAAVARLIPIGFGVALVGWLRVSDLPDTIRAQVGLLFGVSAAALLLRSGSGRPRPEWPLALAISLGALIPAGLLGQIASGEKSSESGAVLGFAVLLASVLGWGIAKGMKDAIGTLAPAVGTALIVLAGWLLSKNYFQVPEMGWIVTASAICALAVAWLLPEDRQQSSFSVVLCGVLWLGIATFGFSQLQGFGMAVAALPAGLLLVANGRWTALASMAPLFMLVAYRLFRERYVDASRALDIGQHYAIVGLLIGLLLVLGCMEWMKSRERRDGVFSSIGAALAGLLCLYLLVGSTILLGAKGAVGLLIGCGFAPFVAALSAKRTEAATAWGFGLMAFLTLAYGTLGDNVDLEREAKVGFVIRFVVIAVIGALAVRLLSGKAKEVQS